jgi:drug/metabolite transporter (DMT)-like permease
LYFKVLLVKYKKEKNYKKLIKMKKVSIIFFQTLIVITGIAAAVMLIRFPLTEGRAAHLDLLSIYADPFILYGYAASIAFFVALYYGFKLLTYIDRHKLLSSNAVKALKHIRLCAILLSISIALAGIFIALFHNKEDDPAGFLAICIVTTFASSVIAIIATVFQKRLQSAIAMKSE